MKKTKKVSFDQRCLISCDLDGTLLNNKGQISQFSKKVIKEITDAGHIFCINTARPYEVCKQFYKQLGLNTPIAAHNGAIMFNPTDPNFPTTNWAISKELIKELIGDRNVRQHSSNAIIDAHDKIYVYCKNNWSENQWKKIINDFGIFTTNNVVKLNGTLRGYDNNAYSVFFVPKNNDHITELINAIKTKIPTMLTKVWRVENMGVVIQASTPNCSKVAALKDIATYYGIPSWRTLAFGDGLDDAEMLKYAIGGYAMKNGSNDAQMAASYITKWTNDEDGVAKTLILIKKLINKYK